MPLQNKKYITFNGYLVVLLDNEVQSDNKRVESLLSNIIPTGGYDTESVPNPVNRLYKDLLDFFGEKQIKPLGLSEKITKALR